VTRPRGFIENWRPREKSLVLLEKIEAVIAEYAMMALTIRQIFYRLVARHGLAKTEHAYKNLAELLNRARRARRIPMNAIRDDGSVSYYPVSYRDAEDFLARVRDDIARFRLDRQKGQQRRLVVMCEAAGMAPQLFQLTEPYGIPVLSGGGFDSTSEKHRLCEIWAYEAPPICVLRIGDYDASGASMHMALMEDVIEFARSYGGEVEFVQVAITPEQARAHDPPLPSAPPKETDRRGIHFNDTETWQAEALDPNELAQILGTAIRERFDMAAYRAVLAEEEEARRILIVRLGLAP
jgi:hypothetical protein